MIKFQSLMVSYDTILKCIALFENKMVEEGREEGVLARSITNGHGWSFIGLINDPSNDSFRLIRSELGARRAAIRATTYALPNGSP